jgi:hypothetical protein
MNSNNWINNATDARNDAARPGRLAPRRPDPVDPRSADGRGKAFFFFYEDCASRTTAKAHDHEPGYVERQFLLRVTAIRRSSTS